MEYCIASDRFDNTIADICTERNRNSKADRKTCDSNSYSDSMSYCNDKAYTDSVHSQTSESSGDNGLADPYRHPIAEARCKRWGFEIRLRFRRRQRHISRKGNSRRVGRNG